MLNTFSKKTRVTLTTAIASVVMVSLFFSPLTNIAVSAQTTTAEIPETFIDTGTAAAASDSYTIENITDIQTDSQQATGGETAETIPESEGIDFSFSGTSTATSSDTIATTTPVTVVGIENEAAASTSATTTAISGSNTATGSSTTVISTGDAYAYSNVVNLTNTNIINSIGFIVFLNQLFGFSGADIRDLFDVFSVSNPTDPCANNACEARQLEYYINNQSNLDNNLIVSADTGNNYVGGTTGIISTGDAYAAANVTNIANSNIIDANYMVLTFSNFGDLLGDIVLPGKYLLEKLFQNISGTSAPVSLNTNNQVTIENNIAVNANTGDNTTVGSSTGIITGNATTYSNVYNQTNTNAINADSFTMLFRVSGDWDGQVYGLPDGLSWQRTASGILISNAPDFGQTAASTELTSADITNAATINNAVSVSANTGSNQVDGNLEGYVETGTAYAAANVTNIANTNILGRNWSLLIFDIFGNWQGNISFGKPDLWIGGTANTNGSTAAGEEVTYTFTISNLGDAEATDVKLSGSLTSDLMSLAEPMQDIELGSLSPGETVERTVTARVASEIGSDSYPIDLIASLSSAEPDENLANNTEVVTVIVENIVRSSGGSSGTKAVNRKKAADLSIVKTSNLDSIAPGDRVSYEITIKNLGGPVYGATLFDTLLYPNEEVVNSQQWYLETIDSDETIVITYDTEYSLASPPGTYSNRAQVLGYHKNRVPRYMETYDSMVATSYLTILDGVPQVLGATTSACNPYLTSFLKSNAPNDEMEVRRLQTFLNVFSSLKSPANGTFDLNTENAVKSFQQKYATDILDPWELDSPTGHVYFTTRKKINELFCNNTEEFPLSIAELSEISRYRLANNSTWNTFAANSAPTPTPLLAQADEEAVLPPSQEEVEVKQTITVESNGTNQNESTLFNRIVQWVKKPSLPKLKLWNNLLASKD